MLDRIGARRVLSLATPILLFLGSSLIASATPCTGPDLPVAAGQRHVRVAEGVVAIEALDDARSACIVRLSIGEGATPGALILEPGVDELLHERLPARAQMVTFSNFGEHVVITRNGERVLPLSESDAHVGVFFEPGDLLSVRSGSERMALPVTTLPLLSHPDVLMSLFGQSLFADPALASRNASKGVLRLETPELGLAAAGALAISATLEHAGYATSQGFSELVIESRGRALTLAFERADQTFEDPDSVTLRAMVPLADLDDPASVRVVVRYADGSDAPDATLRRLDVEALGARGSWLPGTQALAPSTLDPDEPAESGSAASDPAFGSAPPEDDPAPTPETRATGLRPPTPEEEAWMQANMVRTGRVRFNALALERLERAGVPLPRDLRPVAVGTEVQALRDVPMLLEAPEEPVGLPVAVDNSTLAAFPAIDTQGSQGSCAAFSSTYYVMTHMHCLARGCDAKSGGHAITFSPAFTYNLINGGSDSGSWFSSAYGVMKSHGSPTWNEFPYEPWGSDPLRHRRWPTDFDTWRVALDRRIDTSGTIYGVETASGLQQLKELLVNGYVLNYATFVNSWVYTTISDDPATSDDDAFVGKQVVSHVAGSSGAHGMTLVGYDDRVWVDINGNGSVDTGEKGALRIANSWGYWKEAGFTWIAYDALNPVSAVPGGPAPANRDGAFWYEQAYWITARPAYEPSAVAEITLAHAQRDQVHLRVGQGQPGSFTVEEWSYPWAPTGDGGPYAFDGSDGGSALPATFAIDFTDLAEEDVARSWFARAQDTALGAPLDIEAFALHDQLGRRIVRSASVPLQIDGESVEIKLEHVLDATPSTSLVPGETLESWLRPADRPHRECAVFEITLPCGSGTLGVDVSGLGGDADLVVLHESQGSPCGAPAAAACHVDHFGSDAESCLVDLPGPGRWLAAVRNVDIDDEIDFSITASVVDTTTPQPVHDLALSKPAVSSSLDLAWSRPAACGTRAPATRYGVHALLWSPGGAAPSFPAASDAFDSAAASVGTTLEGTPTPAEGQVYLVTVIPENGAGAGEALP